MVTLWLDFGAIRFNQYDGIFDDQLLRKNITPNVVDILEHPLWASADFEIPDRGQEEERWGSLLSGK